MQWTVKFVVWQYFCRKTGFENPEQNIGQWGYIGQYQIVNYIVNYDILVLWHRFINYYSTLIMLGCKFTIAAQTLTIDVL